MDEKKIAKRKGIMGWLNTSRLSFEGWAYVFQRITGLGILAYVIGHITDTSFFVGGPFGDGPSSSTWSQDLSITEGPVGRTILVLTVLIVTYHGINGVRLVLAEHGIIFQKPSTPEYPYKPKSARALQKHLIWVAIIVAILAALYSGSILFG